MWLNSINWKFRSDDWNNFRFFHVKQSQNLPYSFDARTKRMSWRFSDTNRAAENEKNEIQHTSIWQIEERRNNTWWNRYVNLFAYTHARTHSELCHCQPIDISMDDLLDNVDDDDSNNNNNIFMYTLIKMRCV